MINKILPAMLTLILAAGLCAAQASGSTVSSPTPNSLQIQLGAFFPNSGDARFVGGQTQLTAGLDYNLSSSGGLAPAATNAFFDYTGGAKNGDYIHSGGLGLQYQTVGRGYVGAGLGIYNTSVKNADGLTGSVTGGGGKLFAGLNLDNRTSLELDYHVLPSTMGVNPSGVGLELGFKL
jgi:hypothetical protein